MFCCIPLVVDCLRILGTAQWRDDRDGMMAIGLKLLGERWNELHSYESTSGLR